jgi:HAE1 family hydrophobic/amphiphilic exporter-1
MMPVAVGVGAGAEFYSPMAVAIIGGTITSTLLTLLIVPTFYDSIEIARERAAAKFLARAESSNVFKAGVVTFVEALATLLFLRWLYRRVRGLLGIGRSDQPPGGAAPSVGTA